MANTEFDVMTDTTGEKIADALDKLADKVTAVEVGGGGADIPATGSESEPVYFSATNTPTGIFGTTASRYFKLGYNVTCTGNYSMAIGNTASTSSYTNCVAVGYYARCVGNYSVALGYNAYALGDSVALGYNASADEYSVALGYDANAYRNSVALGYNAYAEGEYSVALGYNAYAGGECSVALGYNAYASAGEYSVALGYNAYAGGEYSVALGHDANAGGSEIWLGTGDQQVYGGNYNDISDIRDKTDIESYDDDKSLEFLTKLDTFTYRRNDRLKYAYTETKTRTHKDKDGNEVEDTDENGEPITYTTINTEKRKKYGLGDYDKEAWERGEKKGTRKHSGFSAQNIQEVMEEVFGDIDAINLVNDNLYNRRVKDGEEIPADVETQLTVKYSSFIPIIVSAMKAQQKTIEELKAEIAELKKS